MTLIPPNPRARLARASFWTMAGTGVHLGAGMLASIAAARLLGPTHFGELAITRTTFFTFTLLAGANLGVATSRAVAALRAVDPERAGRALGVLLNLSLITSALAALICLVLAGPIARQLGAPQLTMLLALSAPGIIFASISAVQIGAMNGFEAFGSAGRLLALEGIITGVLLVCGAYLRGVPGAVAGMIAAAVIAFLLRRRLLAATCHAHGVVVHRRGVAGEIPFIRGLVVPSVLFGFGAPPFAWLARAILARGEHGLADVGVFSAAYSWGSAVLTVPAQVTRPAMPILTNLLANGDTASFKRLLRDTLLLALGTAVLAAMPVLLLAPWIMRAYGSRFASGALVLSVIVVSSILASVSSALRSALVASGQLWGQVVQSLLWGVALVGTFFFLRRHGALGLAAAYTIAFALSLVVQAGMTAAALRMTRRTAPATDIAENMAAAISVLPSDDPES